MNRLVYTANPRLVLRVRKRAGLTQGKVAARAGVSIETYRRFEYGKGVNLDTAMRCSGALEAKMNDLQCVEAEAPEEVIPATARKLIVEIGTDNEEDVARFFAVLRALKFPFTVSDIVDGSQIVHLLMPEWAVEKLKQIIGGGGMAHAHVVSYTTFTEDGEPRTRRGFPLTDRPAYRDAFPSLAVLSDEEMKMFLAYRWGNRFEDMGKRFGIPVAEVKHRLDAIMEKLKITPWDLSGPAESWSPLTDDFDGEDEM